MARKSILRNPKRVTFNIETELHRAAVKRLNSIPLSSLSDYIARLIVSDLRRKISAAETTSRHISRSVRNPAIA